MKITKVSSWREDFELSRPYTIAYRTIDAVANLIVKIETDKSLYGLGSASPGEHVTGETADECLEGMLGASWLEGVELETLRPHTDRLKKEMSGTPAGRVALEMALYDLVAKEKNMPLGAMLGLKHRSLPTSITIGIKSVEEAVREAQEYLNRGFQILKVKLGKSVEEDIERTLKLREKVGPKVGIRVDLNQGYAVDDFQEYFKAVEHANIELFEQPFPADDIEAMRSLPKNMKCLIAADESLIHEENAQALTEGENACGIFNIKLMKCGGITSAMNISKIAKEHGVDLMWGCNDESRISISAALHTAFACENTKYIDLDGSLDLGRDIATGGFTIKSGMMSLTDQPGLGVSL